MSAFKRKGLKGQGANIQQHMMLSSQDARVLSYAGLRASFQRTHSDEPSVLSSGTTGRITVSYRQGMSVHCALTETVPHQSIFQRVGTEALELFRKELKAMNFQPTAKTAVTQSPGWFAHVHQWPTRVSKQSLLTYLVLSGHKKVHHFDLKNKNKKKT